MCGYLREGLEQSSSASVSKSAPKRLAHELHAFTSALIEPDALALGDAYQRAVVGIVEKDDDKAFALQIAVAVTHGFSGRT
jgi:hypothetical protein